jgi:hypothetical protein
MVKNATGRAVVKALLAAGRDCRKAARHSFQLIMPAGDTVRVCWWCGIVIHEHVLDAAHCGIREHDQYINL